VTVLCVRFLSAGVPLRFVGSSPRLFNIITIPTSI
jgi:hypothetical protein